MYPLTSGYHVSDEEEILRKPCYGRTEKKKKKEMKAEKNPKGSLEDGIQ